MGSLFKKKKGREQKKDEDGREKVETKAKNAGYPAVSTTFYDSGTSTCLAVAQHGDDSGTSNSSRTAWDKNRGGEQTCRRLIPVGYV